ncbi:unnamed protein product [Polarella glacialis]|uniref:Extradiol ring-cleavage dioxygenase class III enzyme subunit B domain-containing protein n=1 Tax=Polarella glacialis TaxID=89957 RepID=A0A813IZ56_POLGL|nr:unnamed protein product [Polarella glacialis]
MASSCAPSSIRMPCAFLDHGGGPMPLLGQQPEAAKLLGGYAAQLPGRPSAVLVVTAHWETGTSLKVCAADQHSLLLKSTIFCFFKKQSKFNRIFAIFSYFFCLITGAFRKSPTSH